uniref:BPTI/Kunitz inhibitor domain-containing protein n=1 Tax=Romanomermis culicivorax TaxID=13658 RepID=A0A915L2V6_ROMCU
MQRAHGTICSLPKNAGTVCDDNVKELRWYFNESKFQCMAFTFLGCGGNGNNFVSLKECQRSCMPSM